MAPRPRVKLRAAPSRLGPAVRQTLAPPAKVADPFYSSPEWRALIARLTAERGRRCEECGRTGCRIYGDHIRELRDGGAPLDEGNVLLRCPGCHGRKTAAERVRRIAEPVRSP